MSWQLASASRKGSSHGEHEHNQDAVRAEQLDDAWVAAVSDGHGGARYMRSEVGSRLAVDTAVECLTGALAEMTPEMTYDDVMRQVAHLVVETWQARVLEHAAEHPFTDAERQRCGADDPATAPLISYGATLILAVAGEQGVAIGQVGDGDVLVRTNGFATRPVPGDDRLVAGRTTSLCLETATEDFRFAWVPPTIEVDLVVLASDGYGNSFAETDWWQALVDDLAKLVTRHGFSGLASGLSDWLGESALIGGDDVTAVVLAREPLAPPATPLALHSAAPPAPSVSIPEQVSVEHVIDHAAGPPTGISDAGPIPDPVAIREQRGEAYDPPTARNGSEVVSNYGGRGGRRLVWLAIAVAIVTVGLVGLVLTMNGGDSSTPTDTPEPTTPVTKNVPPDIKTPTSKAPSTTPPSTTPPSTTPPKAPDSPQAPEQAPPGSKSNPDTQAPNPASNKPVEPG